jgi:signal transduction histidine kinase
MDGSPVRGQLRAPIVQLNESTDLENFQAEVVRLVAGEFKQAQIFFSVVDTDSKIMQLPAWIKSHLERHAGLQTKLEQGEMVGISAAEDIPAPRPMAAPRSSVVLIPVISNARLGAAIGLVSPLDEPPLSVEDIEVARQFAYEVAPLLSRLQEVERLRRQNQQLLAKAERLNQAEEEILALTEEKNTLHAILQMRSHQQVNITHELRTPLAAIRGYVRMILDGRAGEINEKQTEYLRIVNDNTNRLITLVAWMSYVAGLSAQHLKLSPFDFRDIWTECAGKSQQKLAEKSLKLNQHIAEESFVIIADREKLAGVLDELIAVAVKLAEARGTITVELSHGREGEVSFKLSQTGGEIPAEILSKIFDPSANIIGKPTAQNAQSSVMSLSRVYDVVGMHGGRVFANNTAGQGATFLFTLPAVSAGAEENSHEQAVNSSRRRR